VHHFELHAVFRQLFHFIDLVINSYNTITISYVLINVITIYFIYFPGFIMCVYSCATANFTFFYNFIFICYYYYSAGFYHLFHVFRASEWTLHLQLWHFVNVLLLIISIHAINVLGIHAPERL